jgi:hypothetical protein
MRRLTNRNDRTSEKYIGRLMNPAAHTSDRLFFRVVPAILISALMILFTVGIVHLFLLRFDIGDIYPAYSSFRSDPLGTKAYYESLSLLDRIDVSRNLAPLRMITTSQDAAFFFLGAGTVLYEFISREGIKSFSDLALTGGRLVISFFPLQEMPLADNQKSYSRSFSTHALTTQWGVSFTSEKKRPNAKSNPTARRKIQADLPDKVIWRSSLYFDKLHPSWKIIYTLDEKPVIIERSFGRGSIVLVSDSYLFSNEALSKDRHPKLLAWFVQNHRSVIFDEYHFGVRAKPGLMHVIRRHNFHGVILGFLITAALFIWKNAVPLVPPKHSVPYDPSADGKDHLHGLICLLRRNISEKEVLKICYDEWKKTVGKNKNKYPELIQNKMESAVRDHYRADPVKGYQMICRMLR